MQLISALAAGISGAENGYAQLYRRGTSTRASWYSTFEADGQDSSGGNIALDSRGGVTVYVNEVVDVRVFASNGDSVRDFTSGVQASAVEVISRSFTGVDYDTGASAADKPTTLQAVLDSLLTSFGSTNFNVLLAGASRTLQSALASVAQVYFNVKDSAYGAVGDGVTNDATAVQAAITAAAVAGGIVFFPPGTYRITSALTKPFNVSLLGAGSGASVISVDGAAINGIVITGGGRQPSFIQDLAVKPAQANTGSLISAASSNYTLDVSRCALMPGAGAVNGFCVQMTGTDAVVNIEGCLLQTTGTQTAVGNNAGFTPVGDLRVINCLFRNQGAGGASFIVANTCGSAIVLGCAFEALSSTVGYTGVSLSAIDGLTNFSNGKTFALVAGCRFPDASSGTVAAITFITEGMEFGNTFGPNGVIRRNSAFSGAATASESTGMASMDRRHRKVAVATTAHTVPQGFGHYTIIYTGAGDLTLTLPDANESGKELRVEVHNDTVTNRTINLPAATRGATSFAVNGNTFTAFTLRATYINGNGYWYSTGEFTLNMTE